MKNIIFLSICLLLLSCSYAYDQEKINRPLEGTFKVFCTPDLYNLTTKWTNEFSALHTNVKIDVFRNTESPGEEIFDTGRNLGFISNEFYSKLDNNSLWKMVVGRDVIVPIFSSKNPFLEKIEQQGISPDELAESFNNPGQQKWGTILDNAQNDPVAYYLLNDSSFQKGIANFLNLDQTALNGIEVENGHELISQVQKKPYAIGFCRLADLQGHSNSATNENIRLLPIDRNGNGEIDYIENIYDDVNVLSRGVWIGKYPRALYNNIYSISSKKPTNKTELAFLNWILTDGQQFLLVAGYSDLVLSEIQSKIGKLNEPEVILASLDGNTVPSKSILIFIVGFIVAVFVVLDVIVYSKHKKLTARASFLFSPKIFNEDSVNVLGGLFYDKTHTWAYMEKSGVVRIGIDDFLQHITGLLTRIKMRNPGEKIKKGDQILSIIQNGKQLNINSPISGIIKSNNNLLSSNSSMVNSSPYSDGWVYMIEPTNWLREIQFLIMGKKYKEWLKIEFSRLKDFLAISLKPQSDAYAHSVFQEGGELTDGILADLGPEVWEDFQNHFIDTAS
ncbi:MAG: hypothetical protein D4R64_18575 [Porphyromonadaceae bacterium]|nr:MAG: hypothetical protein D4R64_18575 [Porphyromonadaceae bacterium]